MPSFDMLWKHYTQEEVADMYYAYCETKGIKIKSNVVEAKELGFTDDDLAAVRSAMRGARRN